ncbi:uncharacterized protein LOC118268126 isoform X2 [Spodoptera frugiperda]|uniref:Galectin n=1 Tax=Spodoptera frugiperda TaxID=7108 RepID=A0A9R0D2Y2_SPOFR|nr:uncharacterized protein LOC118268126 isoform X2 [Spodoptera frugiperda]
MLQSCWECLAGNRRSVDDPYSAANNLRINGNGNVGFGIRAPPWPVSTPNTKMFLLPKQLEPDDIISIECKIKEDKQKNLTIALVTENDSQPDPKNVACQVDVKEDGTVVINTNKGTIEQHQIDPPKIDDTKFVFRIREANNGFGVEVKNGDEENYITYVPVHDVSSIRYISVEGDITKYKLSFESDFSNENS